MWPFKKKVEENYTNYANLVSIPLWWVMKMLDEIVHEELGTEVVLSSDMKIFKLEDTDILYIMHFKSEEEANLFRLTQGIK